MLSLLTDIEEASFGQNFDGLSIRPMTSEWLSSMLFAGIFRMYWSTESIDSSQWQLQWLWHLHIDMQL